MRTTFFAYLLAGGVALAGAELSVTGARLDPGGAAVAEIRFAAQGSKVAAFQVDLHFDAAQLRISTSAGPAATAKEKLVDSAEATPGRRRILLMGFNQTVLDDGVVVSLLISSRTGTPGLYSLQLRDAVASDKDGNLVAVATINGSVAVLGGDGTPHIATLGQVVSGGPWKTTLTMVNVSGARASARLNFWGGDGQPLPLPLAFPGPAVRPAEIRHSLDCALDPDAMLVIETEAPDAVETLSGWAELRSSHGVLGYAVLRWRQGHGRDSEAMLAFEQRGGATFVLPYDNSGGFQTGIAITNRSPDAPAQVSLIMRDEAGATLWTEALPLAARGHTAFVAGGRFPVLAGRRGTIEVRGNAVTALGLRVSPSGSFTSIPAISRD